MPWIPTAVALALLVALRHVSGSWLGTSVADKSLLANYGLVHSLDLAAKYGVDVTRGLLLGLYPAESPIGFSQGQAPFVFPPLGLLFILLVVAKPPTGFRVPVWAWLALVAAVFALVGPNLFMGVHFNRYLMWAFPGLLAFVAVGLGIASRLSAREDATLERALFRTVAALFVVLGLLSTVRFAAVYAEMAASIWRREVPTAEWIRRNLPPGVAIANGATSIAYLTGHRNLNLHGVTSPGFGGTRSSEKEAGYFEALARRPAAERPPYLLVPRSSVQNSDLLPRLIDGSPVFQTASLRDDFLIHRTRWGLLDTGPPLYLPATLAAVAGLDEVGQLNICDREDEAAHSYRHRSRRGDIELGGFVRVDDYALATGPVTVADAGRLILGEERFRVPTRAGRRLVVVVRSHPRAEARALRAQGGLVAALDVPTAALVVRADGREVARLALVNAPGWNEHVFEVPGGAVADGHTELHLSGQYTAFRYWFFQ